MATHLQVILRESVDKLGKPGQLVRVKPGYARNYLLPRGLAELATPGLVRELERRDALRARHEAKSHDEARAIADRLEATELRFEVNAGPTGSLFGSVTATNVADRLWDGEKIRIDRRKVSMQTIKRIGRYTVPIEVFQDVTAELRLLVVPEGGELPPEEVLAAAATADAAAPADETSAPAEPEPALSAEPEPVVPPAADEAEAPEEAPEPVDEQAAGPADTEDA